MTTPYTPPMTPAAKRALSTTIRALRERLLTDLHAATETTYRLSVAAREAGLDEAARARRARLEAWMKEQSKAASGKRARGEAAFRLEAEKQAAYTLLNRLVLLRLMEAGGARALRQPALVTGGWESRAYRDFRQLAPALCQMGSRDDETEGYGFLLRLTFEELATELPGLYGPAGVADLVPVPPATLRHVIDALNDTALDTCWSDDMTLGWVYQYWNDPEREALDAKLNDGGKVEPHEIASKTQMFTERYMVDWLLQNTLGPLFLGICARNDWTPEVVADGTLDRLEARRADWRARRAAGDLALTDLMPLDTEAERRWAYFLPTPIAAEAADRAPASVLDVKLLDPAVGSGHFLVVALELLFAMACEERRHRAAAPGAVDDPAFTDAAIVERLLSHTLHGVDLDPRAVQIAAAALWLKAQTLCPGARPERLNLVAANLRLSSLPDTDAAVVELRREVERETGMPGALTDTLVHALRGADHLGTLLRVDAAVEAALTAHEQAVGALGRPVPEQGGLFTGFSAERKRVRIGRDTARATLLDRLDGFLAKHTHGDDLGLRLRGEQLAAGVRFVRLVREGAYDIVVANPPYQGTAKMADTKYVEQAYPLGKADLYAAFLLRGLELVKPGGFAAQVSMSGWMFLKQYAGLRKLVLEKHMVHAVVDLLWCAFEQMRHNTVAMYALKRGPSNAGLAVGLTPTPRDEREESIPALQRKRAATLCHEGRHTFDPAALKVVPEWPLVYWWDADFLHTYDSAPKLGVMSPCKVGIVTGDNGRFVRRWHELGRARREWASYVSGARGMRWIDPCDEVLNWRCVGLETKVLSELRYGSHTRQVRNEHLFFHLGVACTAIGSNFGARLHRRPSIIGSSAASVFPVAPRLATVLLNSSYAAGVLSSLNPGVHFEVGDINRLPMIDVAGADAIFAQVEAAFTTHEAHREPSVEFRRPGPSPWRQAQAWAQTAVDRPEGAPLPEYIETLDPEPPTDHVSFALGVALGRFGAAGSSQEGVLDPATADLSGALPDGLLFLDCTLAPEDLRDGLGHPAAAPLHAAWAAHAGALDAPRGLRAWLARDFFGDVHKPMYENRPIHWPLSSADRTFVAWVNIHRLTESTLRVLLADHLMPTLGRIEGELNDLRLAREGADKKAARAAERQYDTLRRAREDLVQFIERVEACADRGPPPATGARGAACPPRERDARSAPDLDDGVMINSAALWSLLEPQWKDPKKWWVELTTSAGKKDYDWAHLAMRYWPTRVDAKCRKDPSLGVAHGCFWRYHPERAWAWELRLQDEIGPEFRITEPPYRPGDAGDAGDAGDGPHREAFLRENPEAALAAIEKEAARRMGRGGRGRGRAVVAQMPLLESGLWSAHAEALWQMELRLAEKQGAELRITAPDEPEARAAYAALHPERVRARERFLADLVPLAELFDTAGGPDDADAGDDDADDGDDDDGDEP